jgi:8-oxo-dGTP diphosphatase
VMQHPESAARDDALPADLHSIAMVGIAVRWGLNYGLLAIRHAETGEWGLPTRTLAFGESFEQCVQRAVRETTGVATGLASLRAVHKNMAHPAGLITLVWRTSYAGGEPVAAGEASEAAWLTPQEAIDRMPEVDGKSVHNALSHHGDIVLTDVHDGTRFIR